MPGDKYLFLNGDTITKTDHPELYSHLVIADPKLRVDAERCELPDFRGLFLRGWDNGGKIDPNRTFGSIQDDRVRNHTHSTPNNILFLENSDKRMGSGAPALHVDNARTTGIIEESVRGDETRPKNVAVNYIIRAKS